MAMDPTRLYEHLKAPERLTLVIEAMARDDVHEVERLERSCPRVGYTGPDIKFSDRYAMAFDILAVMTIDLRCMWGKLHVLQWVLENVHPLSAAHHVTAALAFVEGERCGKGQSQTEFFAKPLPRPEEYIRYGDDDADDTSDDEPDADEDPEPTEDDGEVVDPTPRQIERATRLEAVEKRAEHFTACGTVALLCAMKDIAQDLVNTWTAFGKFCRTRLGVEPETMLRAWQFPLDDFLDVLQRHDKVKPDPAKVREYCGFICSNWDRRFKRKQRDEDEGGQGDE